MFRKVGILIIIFNIVCVSLLANISQTVGAVTASDWKSGNIINDFVFTDKDAMSVSQIQTFLNGRVGTGTNGIPGQCDTYGVRTSEYGGGTRAQYAANASLHPIMGAFYPPFTCLKDFYEVPKTVPGPSVPANNYDGKKIPVGAKSAAQLIWDAAQINHISPKVLLVKLGTESAGPLTSDDWPTLSQYTYAMGAHCPDSGPGGSANCDADYSGFSIQISESAKMLRGYLDDMDQAWWGCIEGGVKVQCAANRRTGSNPGEGYKVPYTTNAILWDTTSGCGTGNIYIENKATAALYTYTPYQPNQAALNDMYGIGDSCSSFGNRNFWRTYNDWFGSSYYSDIVRTIGSATVYLISGNNKYPISNSHILSALFPLGHLSYVPQKYLDSKVTGQTMGRVIKGSGSALYYFDAGIKLAFTSCDQVVDYGYSCGSPISLTDFQIGEFSTGPNMTNVYRTTSGKRFYITAGEKKEVFDDSSLQQIGISLNTNVLGEAAISNLEYGSPVIREDVVVVSRETNKKYLFQKGTFVSLSTDISNYNGFSKLPNNKLDIASIDTLTIISDFKGFAKDGSNNKYVIDSIGKALLSNPDDWTASFIELNDTLLGSMDNSQQPVNSGFIKADKSSTLYFVTGGKKYSISNWIDFLNLHLDGSADYANISKTTSDAIIQDSTIYSPGSLIKSASNSTVYVVNGILSKIALTSFAISDDLGLNWIRIVSQSDLDAHVSDSGSLSNFISCDNKNYLANRGIIYEIDTQASSMYGYDTVSYGSWDSVGCVNLNKSPVALSNYSFVKLSDSKSIYYINGGQKHSLSSMTKYKNLGGLSGNLLIVSPKVLNMISTGPAA